VTIPQSVYSLRSSVPITATVLVGGKPSAGTPVVFSLSKVGGAASTKKATTGTNGTASWSYKASSAGSYAVTATVTSLGTTTSIPATFTVR
jgi:hypothetical protein